MKESNFIEGMYHDAWVEFKAPRAKEFYGTHNEVIHTIRKYLLEHGVGRTKFSVYTPELGKTVVYSRNIEILDK